MFPISGGLAFGLIIIPMLAFLIIIHELGHFFAARSVGVKVEEFGIGIPPRAKGWRRGGVLWSLNWIPFGGFVRVKGEDGADMGEGSMNTKGPLQRAFFLVAGSSMNFIAAIVISILLVAFQGTPVLDSTTYIGDVVPGSPAERAGWLPGDTIVQVGNTEITSGDALQSAISDATGKEVPVVIQRGDERIETTVTPRENPPANEGATGIGIVEGERATIDLTSVEPGSAADRAGWQEGDRIVAIGGVAIESEPQARALLIAGTGQDVPVTIERDGERIDTTLAVASQSIVVSGVAADSPASRALLYPGDHIAAIGETPIIDGVGLVDTLAASSGATVPVEILRDGDAVTVQLTVPEIASPDTSLNVIGINARIQSPYEAVGADALLSRIFVDVGITQIIPEGWSQFWAITSGTFEGIRQMVTEGIDPDTLTGPVGMGQLTSELLSQSSAPPLLTIGMITVVISVALGVLNLLPFPALDGGRLLFVLIEILRGGRRISPEKEGLVHLAGMVVLLGMMAFVAFGDVSRLVDGRSILP